MAALDHAFVRAFARAATVLPELASVPPAAALDQKFQGSISLPDVVEVPEPEGLPDTSASWSWPEICPQLTARVNFKEFGERLYNTCRAKNLHSVAFSGADRGVGRSTVLLTLAQALCQSKSLKLLLVDANFGHPSLARELETIPDADPVVLIPARLQLLTLANSYSVVEARAQWPQILEKIAAAAAGCDLVLVDGGAWTDRTGLWSRPAVDAVIQVNRHAATDAEALQVEAQACRAVGIELLGRIETFA